MYVLVSFLKNSPGQICVTQIFLEVSRVLLLSLSFITQFCLTENLVTPSLSSCFLQGIFLDNMLRPVTAALNLSSME